MTISPTTTLLVIGAGGQIGADLVEALQQRYPRQRVLATDIRPLTRTPKGVLTATLDVTDAEALDRILTTYQVSEVYHLAAILSAKGEENPLWAWDLNMRSLLNVLEAARQRPLKVFWPSSIAVHGPTTPRHNTPQHSVFEPATVYGISKLAGEHWCQYYYKHYGVDVRSLRYPGLISYKGQPGGGTTDYAVDIFHHALRQAPYTCFLREDTALPMMYMPDAIRATLALMEAPEERLSIRTSYNVGALSFTPAQLADELRRHLPALQVCYAPDHRQAIADSWADSIDDSLARQDWDWQPECSLADLCQSMIAGLRPLLEAPQPPQEAATSAAQ